MRLLSLGKIFGVSKRGPKRILVVYCAISNSASVRIGIPGAVLCAAKSRFRHVGIPLLPFTQMVARRGWLGYGRVFKRKFKVFRVLLSGESSDCRVPLPQLGKNAKAMFERKLEMVGISVCDRIAIAVSGGPDSMALCLLAFEWKQRHKEDGSAPIDEIFGMTVDHGFRHESADEAMQVQQWLKNIGMRCEILKCCWPEGIPLHGHLQESARKARYELLQDACRKNGVGVLLTAHHADDQAELFVLRLSRSSGVAGLAGMALITELFPCTPSPEPHKVLLVRPLLDFFKSELYEVCQNAGQEWIEDPTNSKPVFARNRIRKALRALSCSMQKEIQDLISVYRKKRADLDGARDKLTSEFVSVNLDYGYVVIDVERLFRASTDEAVHSRMLVATLQFVAQKGKPPRGRAIQALMEWLHQQPIQSALTVAGCYLCPYPGSRGSKVLVTFSPDSPRPSNNVSVKNSVQERRAPSSELSKEVEGRADHVLMEAKAMQILSESTACFLGTLSKEMAEDMHAKNERIVEDGSQQALSPSSTIEQNEWSTLLPGRSTYFMDRFVISWWQEHGNDADERSCCSDCFLRNSACLKIRYFEENDLSEIRKLVGLETDCSNARRAVGERKMHEAWKLLKSLPKYVRRGLPVLTTEDNTLIGIPGVGFQLCPNTRMIIKFCPRVPLGGGQCSWL